MCTINKINITPVAFLKRNGNSFNPLTVEDLENQTQRMFFFFVVFVFFFFFFFADRQRLYTIIVQHH